MMALVPYSARFLMAMLALACLMPYVMTALAKTWGRFGAKDNQHPRAFLASLTGRAARAHAASQNGLEGLILFLPAVVLAMHSFVPMVMINFVVIMYVISRVLYNITYVANWAWLRSVVWLLGLIVTVFLYYLSLRFMP